MTECPLEQHTGFSSPGKESIGDLTRSRHARLSVRGKRALNRLLMLLPSHLKSQSTPRISHFPPALLFSICDALQLGRADCSAGQNDTTILPLALNKLRGWRLLDAATRYSPGGIYKLALDLAGIIDDASASTRSDLGRPSHSRLRMRWVSSDSPTEYQDRGSVSQTLPSPWPSRPSILDSAQECAHTLPDLKERRFNAGYESCQVGRLGAPDSEDASVIVPPRHRSVSGFRSGCSACRHLRLSGPSTPPSPPMTSVSFSNVNHLDRARVSPPRLPKRSFHHTPTKKTRRENHKSSQSLSGGAGIDENRPPLPSMGVQQAIGVSFPRQRTHSPRISNAHLLREPFSPVVASVQRNSEPSHPFNHARKGDKRTSSHRVASVDLRLSIANTPRNHASSNDLHRHAPTRAQSFSYTPVKSLGLGSVGAWTPKLSSNVVEHRSSGRLPSWSQSHPHRRPTATTTTTTSVTPTGPSSPTSAKVSLPNPRPIGARSRPSNTSIPPRVPSDVKHRDRSVSSQTHKHTSSVPVLPSSPMIQVRKWQI